MKPPTSPGLVHCSVVTEFVGRLPNFVSLEKKRYVDRHRLRQLLCYSVTGGFPGDLVDPGAQGHPNGGRNQARHKYLESPESPA